MGVDEAGGYDVTFGVEDLFGAVSNLANGSNLAAGDAHVGAIARESRAVDDGAVANDEIVLHRSSFFSKT
jgi:hypothetical protein